MTELIRLTRGLWRPREIAADLSARCAALLTMLPTGSVLGGITAAQLHGLWLPMFSETPIEVLLRRHARVPQAHAGSRRREVRARRRHLHPDEIVYLDGLPVTSPARTWLDLAERLSIPDLVAAGDSVLRLGTTSEELEVVTKRAVHRRGVVRARHALLWLDGRSRSRPESHLRYAIAAAGLPIPAVNQPIFDDDGGWLAEPDLSYDDVRLAIEYDGAVHADPQRMRRDITREVDVALRGGWQTVTFGPVQVFRRPDDAVALIRELRRSRSPRPGIRSRPTTPS